MKPSIGRIVHYTLTEQDAQQINRRRTSGSSIADRIKEDKWPIGAQAHIGNSAYAGQSYPCIIVCIWPNEYGPDFDGINGQVILDANDQFWITSIAEAAEATPGKWNWPPRSE